MDPRPLPHNPESERYVCALAFSHPQASPELTARGFSPDWLQIPANRAIWRAIAEYREKVSDVREVDPVTFLAGLQQDANTLNEIGGPVAITGLLKSEAILSREMLDYHVELLRACWQRRQALSSVKRLENSALTGEGFDEGLAETINKLGDISIGSTSKRITNGADALRDFIANLEAQNEGGESTDPPPLKTMIPELDERLDGLWPGFWLVGAETSGGKTAFALQLVRAVLAQGGRVLVFALEMSTQQVIRRIVAAEGRIPMQRLRNPKSMIGYDFTNLGTRATAWNASKLEICDDGDVTIQEVRSIARAEHARSPLALVVLDYIQLASAGRFRDGANREQEISHIGAQCVKMSKELGIPVIAPTQLNDDGKVRESRALKHHAAFYLLIDENQIGCVKGRDTGRDWSIPYRLTGDIQTFERTA